MNVLVIGRGGREHSLVKKLRESTQLDALYVAPGNAGMTDEATCVPIEETDITDLLTFAKEQEIDITIVGPENPLILGIANAFQEAGLTIFAPTKEAAMLEGSKQFAKHFMDRHNIPTADHAVFTDADQAKAYIQKKGAPIVVKADGLAAGKGVTVAASIEEAYRSVDAMLVDKAFADAGATVVIEECLHGLEFSLMAFVHGRNVYPMLPARDHKRAYDNDQGPNTGGMGAFSPVPDVTDDIVDYTTEHVLQRACDGLADEGRPFTGILYAGMMMTEDGPKVIEFNTRFGDPEIQVVLPLLENDLIQVISDILDENDPSMRWELNTACVGVVVASQGYPGAYEKNRPVPEFALNPGAFIIYAGVKKNGEGMLSDGGRVFLSGAKGVNFEEARSRAYTSIAALTDNPSYFYRTDIAAQLDE